MNSSDVVISLLGDSNKNEWTRSEILEIISEGLKIEKREAGSKFDTVNTRTDFFEKISENPVKHKFSKSGHWRYESLKKSLKSGETFRRDFSKFIKTYYWDNLLECVGNYIPILEIDYNNLNKGFPYAAEHLFEDPDKTLIMLNEALQDIELPILEDFKPEVSIYNAGELLQVEDIKTEHINKFVQVEGRVVFQSLPKSELIEGAFKCQRCEHINYVPQGVRQFIEPYKCENDVCNRKGPFKLLDPPESKYIDGQEIVIESLKGQVTVKVHLTKSLTRPPWDRDAKVVRVCGILKTNNTISKSGTRSNVFEWIIEANNIRFADDSNTEPATEDEIKVFEEWAENPLELRKKLLESIAPHIYGMIDVKDLCCLALFSDWNWGLDPREVLERSSIHVLLFGDPGVAKSQIVKDIVYLSPKGKFGQVTNMTKGGLSTVAVQEGGEWCVRSGFFSLADQGVAGLDEIDKVDDQKDLKCLVSVLDDQVQRVSKIGKNDIPFNTRAAVLATANPKGGHLRKEDTMDQIAATIPSYIFQRFDMIYVIRDIPDKEKDRIVIRNINQMHSDHKINRKNIERLVTPELFRKYVLYARSKPVPGFAPNAQKLIEEYYLTLREVSHDYPVIGARQGNNLNRISRAVARREMAPTISEEHVKYAISLLKAGLSTLSEGDDYSMYNYGRTKSQAEMVKSIRDTIKEICKKEKAAKIEEIAFVSGLDAVQVEHALILMEKNKEVYKIKEGYRVP
ncbi:MAG: hypothetical protein OIN66_09355 [Candidatus Methanoperedens sp.]|nr:hypothetical protein [Candidatus Methanoperedens sp.]